MRTTTLADLGEDRLVAQLSSLLASGPSVRTGIGDDCAVLGPRNAPLWQLLKTDAVVEGVHFTPDTAPRRIGWKALCRPISDIAAMGGSPEHALVTIAARRDLPAAWLRALYRGIEAAARRFGVHVVGGETARSPGPLFLSIALTGSVPRPHCVLRSGGRPGDALYVTGRLGGSLAGHHLDFIPRLEEARWLVSNFKPRAMMDLSDGIGSDLPRLAAASHCGFHLDEEKVPRNPGCSLAQALGDGEDFELLFALPPRRCAALEAAWKTTFPRLPLSRIGALTPPTRATKRTPHNAPAAHGFDHFA